jgi:hypothetical protein
MFFYAEGQNKNHPASVYFDLPFYISLNSVKSTKEGKITIDIASVYFNLLFLGKKRKRRLNYY